MWRGWERRLLAGCGAQSFKAKVFGGRDIVVVAEAALGTAWWRWGGRFAWDKGERIDDSIASALSASSSTVTGVHTIDLPAVEDRFRSTRHGHISESLRHASSLPRER